MANLGLKERYDFQQWIIKDLKEKRWLYPAGCFPVRPSISHGCGTSLGFSDGDPGGDYGLSP